MASKKDQTGTDVAEAQDQSQPGTALAEMGAYAEFAGSGFENQTSDDYAIPFLNILQALSPQLQPDAGNDHLKQGMVFNSVTGDYFAGKDGIVFIPATTQHEFIEFKPREAGGGFVGRHAIDSAVVSAAKAASTEFGNYTTPEGNELIETYAVYGVQVLPDGSTMMAVLAFSGSKIKKYKAWQTKAKTIQIALPDGRRIPAPLWAHRYRLKTVSEKNSKGQFYNWDIAFDGASAVECRLSPTDPVAVEARGLIDLLNSGAARAAYESTTGAAASGEESAGTGGKPVF